MSNADADDEQDKVLDFILTGKNTLELGGESYRPHSLTQALESLNVD